MLTAGSIARRAVLATAALSVVAVTSALLPPEPVEAVEVSPPDVWLTKLNTKHKMLFDSPAPAGGIGLIHVMNYYDSYNKSYGVKDEDIRGVMTFYGTTTLYAVNDAMWTKYKIGEFVGAEDPETKQPALVNPWREKPVIIGMTIPGASVESLQKRGAIFIVCDNALAIFSSLLADARGLDPKAVYADLKANILPGVELVPAMVIALEQAHKAGLAYQRQ